MPAPSASLLTTLAVSKFQNLRLQLPSSGPAPGMPKNPSLDYEYRAGPTASAAVRTASLLSSVRNIEAAAGQAGTGTAQTVPPALFLAGSNSPPEIKAQQDKSTHFRDYIGNICSAICSAWSTWQSTATMTGVIINAVTAAGGMVIGPPWTPLILASGPMAGDWQIKRTTAIAGAIGTAWLGYTATLKVSGMPWYPAFAAFPGPVAPPTPNIPSPVIALTQVQTLVSEISLTVGMAGRFGAPDDFSSELFQSIAGAFQVVFNIWAAGTMVTNVMGTGPVPTFAPPYVPVGPVVGGVGTMTPGGFV